MSLLLQIVVGEDNWNLWWALEGNSFLGSLVRSAGSDPYGNQPQMLEDYLKMVSAPLPGFLSGY